MINAGFVLLSLLALAFIIWPLRRRQNRVAPTRKALNVVAYRRRLEEIEEEVAQGLLPESVHTAAKAELDQRLLEDAGNQESAPTVEASATAPAGTLATIALAGTVLVIAAATWFSTGGSIHLAPPQPPAEAEAPDVDTMLASLEQHLAENPGDLEGWTLLGQSRFRMQQFEAAAAAYAQANRVTNRSEPRWLVAEGEARAMAAERDLQGQPDALFAEALGINPVFQKGLWYAGLSAFQRQDWSTALQYWELLRAQPLSDGLDSVLDEQIAVARARAGLPAEAESGPSALKLNLRIDLAPGLADMTLPESAVLFVFAKAVEGPPMPLAALRQPISDWPLEVVLSNDMSMVPGVSMSGFEQWEVVARIAMNGTPEGASGDLEGRSLIDRVDAGQPQRILIDQRLP